MLSSLGTFQSLNTKITTITVSADVVLQNVYGLPIPSYYIPFRERPIADYRTGTGNTTGISDNGTPTLYSTDGIIGNYIRLASASQQYVTLQNINMNTMTSFSISLWVRIGTTSNFSNVWCISNFFKTDSTTKKYTWALFYSSGNIRFEYARDGSEGTVRRGKQQAVNTNQWYHIVCIQRADFSIDIYINNVRSTAAISGQSTTTNPYFNWTSVLHQIGKSSYQNDPYFNGDIDDFRLYANTELTTAHIQTLYDSKTSRNDFVN